MKKSSLDGPSIKVSIVAFWIAMEIAW